MTQPIAARADNGKYLCPVCESSSHKCSVTDDGLRFCRKQPVVPSAWKEVSRNGEWGCYRAIETSGGRRRKSRKSSTPLPPATQTVAHDRLRDVDWLPDVERFAAAFAFSEPVRRQLAEHLRLPVEALGVMRIGADGVGLTGLPDGGRWMFPEYDGGGKVVGIKVRPPDGRRYFYGSKLEIKHPGLSIADGWRDRPGPVFLVEGASDVLAGTHAGLSCVGRPDKEGGVEYLAELLKDWPADRDIVVVGENDRNEKGQWPGKDGMESTARRLQEKLGRAVLAALPPDGSKDVRAWLTDPARASQPWPDRGVELSALLVAAAAGAEPSPLTATTSGENRDPDKWGQKPENPHRLADTYLRFITPAGEASRLRFWRNEFHEWRDGCYHTLSNSVLKARLTDWVQAEFARVWALEMVAWDAKSVDGRGPRPKERDVTTWLINCVIGAIAGRCSLPDDVTPPLWVDGVSGPDPRDIAPLRNALVDVPTGRVIPPTASFFSFAVAPFNYDPAAPPPASWLAAVHRYLQGDAESINCLQEMIGLFLTGQTKYQRMLWVVGNSRTGKGTTLRVIQSLIGKHNYCTPTLNSLSNDFGLSPLVGKTMAFMTDMLVGSKSDPTIAVERILGIVGEDDQTVNRKNLPELSHRLYTRFMIATNEVPNLKSTSGALANRSVMLEMNASFEGSEDAGVEEAIMGELPGILLWALEGFRRLQARGRFVQPARSAPVLDEMRQAGSDVGRFIADRCVVGEGYTPRSDLFDEWLKWCKEKNIKHQGTDADFGRNLRTAVRRLKGGAAFNPDYKPRVDGVQVRCYGGIRIRSFLDDGDQRQERDTIETPSESPQIHTGKGRDTRDTLFPTSSLNGEKNTTGIEVPPVIEIEAAGVGVVSRVSQRPPPPGTWLYVSRKLDLEYLPESRACPVVQLGTDQYFRLTPAVVVWIENAVADRDASGGWSPTELHEVISAQDSIYKFARERFADGELDAARKAGPRPLPEPESTLMP